MEPFPPSPTLFQDKRSIIFSSSIGIIFYKYTFFITSLAPFRTMFIIFTL